jgi:hypothetical protein
MFKNKEIRDNVLLISMAVITIVFLVYIFFPSGESNSLKDQDVKKPVISLSPEKTKTPLIPVGEIDTAELSELYSSLEKEIADIYLTILSSSNPFAEYRVESIGKIINESQNGALKKYSKFSFFDLDDIVNIEFPAEYSAQVKFNIFLSMFLIKIAEENAIKKLEDLSNTEFEEKIRFDYYRLIGNEIDKDYQALPILFYFKLFLNRLNVYAGADDASFFREQIKNIRDLSYSKHLLKIIEFLSFSREPGTYRIEWVEKDGFADSNDKKSYACLSLKTVNFLKQKYLIFPDLENDKNNFWIKDLCNADSGGIELISLKILNENPLKKFKNKRILYTPINPHFIVTLNEYPDKVLIENEFINRIVIARLKEFYKSFQVVDFEEGTMASKDFKIELEKFGNYLKKNPAVQGVAENAN